MTTMPVIAILPADSLVDADQLADTRSSTPGEGGGHVPGGLAGYTYDGAAYCPDCAADVEVTSADGETYSLDHFPPDEWDGSGFGVGVVSGTDEWDYPGATCHVCHKTLQTNILVYDEHGAHPRPEVQVRDPDGQGRTAEAFHMDADDDLTRIMLAEDFIPYGEAGDTSWVPDSDVIRD